MTIEAPTVSVNASAKWDLIAPEQVETKGIEMHFTGVSLEGVGMKGEGVGLHVEGVGIHVEEVGIHREDVGFHCGHEGTEVETIGAALNRSAPTSPRPRLPCLADRRNMP